MSVIGQAGWGSQSPFADSLALDTDPVDCLNGVVSKHSAAKVFHFCLRRADGENNAVQSGASRIELMRGDLHQNGGLGGKLLTVGEARAALQRPLVELCDGTSSLPPGCDPNAGQTFGGEWGEHIDPVQSSC